MNLKLHGIVAYKSKQGFALISSNNGPQKVYGKGESIEEGIIVTNIYPNKVTLSNNGNPEELLLPVDESNAKARPTRRGLPLGGGNTALPSKRSMVPAAVAPPLANTSTENEVEDLNAFRQEVISDPAKLMDIVKPSPEIVDGQFIGFRIQPGTKRKLFTQLDFRPNDIITEVNGIVLDDPSKGAMVLGELAQAANVSVKVKRGDQELFIEHSF